MQDKLPGAHLRHDWNITINDTASFGIEVLGDQFCKQLADSWGKLRRLKHDGATGGEGARL